MMSDMSDQAAISMEEAQRRCAYHLTYDRADRSLTSGGMEGPDIPCAYEGAIDEDGKIHSAHKGSGEWVGNPCWIEDEATPEDWIEFWFTCAIDEAVHEALEHFHVDGKPWLDPHGRMEGKVFDASGELARTLIAILKKQP